MERPVKHSHPGKEADTEVILATKEGITALKETIGRTRQELAAKALQMGQVATDGDRDYHENFQFRDLSLEVQDQIPRRILDLEAQLRRAVIGEGIGNFNRQFPALIETPEEDPEVRTIRLVGPLELNYIGHTGPNNELYLSCESPLGKVLLHANLVPGKTFEFKAPNGQGQVTIQGA